MAGNKKLIQLYYTKTKKYLCSKCAVKIFRDGKVIPSCRVSYTGKKCVSCDSRIK